MEMMLMKKTNTETQVQGTVDRIMSNSHGQTNDEKNDGVKDYFLREANIYNHKSLHKSPK